MDVLGLLPFDEDGQEALDYYVNKALNGSSLWYVPAFFVALWTPDTSEKTTYALCLTEYAAAYITPKVLYHYTSKEAAEEIIKKD